MKIPMGVPEWTIKDWYIAFLTDLLSINSYSKLNQTILQKFNPKNAIFCNLGRQAIYIALSFIEKKSDKDEVILPSYACENVLLPVISSGFIPSFADSLDDLNIDPESVKKLINEKTRAIIIPHLYGKLAKIDQISYLARKNKICLIDDAAQSVGAKIDEKFAGTFGEFGILSFGPFKSLMATKGGMLLVNKPVNNLKVKQYINEYDSKLIVYKRAITSLIKFRLRKYSYEFLNRQKTIRNSINIKSNNWNLTPYVVDEIIPNKMSSIDATIVMNQLKKMETIIIKRQENAKKLTQYLKDSESYIRLPEQDGHHIFTKYVFRINQPYLLNKEKLYNYLRKSGIEVENGYHPLHLKPKYSSYGHVPLKKVEKLAKSAMCLPIHTRLRSTDLKYMANKINYFCNVRFKMRYK